MKRTLSLPIIILLAYVASVCLNASFRQHLLPRKSEADIIERIFGNFRIFIGDWSFMKAEEYHHRGLPFEQATAYHKGESMFAEREQHATEPEHEEANNLLPQKTNLYSKLYSQVKVTGDSHLKPEEEKEVLPWFYVEVAFNPHDIRGYILGGYWLERVGKYNESLKFLQNGIRNNPDSAQILSAIGELYFKKKNYENAAMYLGRACYLWSGAKAPNVVINTYEESDRLFAFDLLASLYIKKGDYDKALKIYTELLKFGPNPAILDKVKKLQKP